jgi:predicted ATPase
MTEPPHLAPAAAAFVNALDHVRLRAIRSDRWVGFSRAGLVLQHLDALCEHPPSTRPPGLAIYGHSGMGKTMLVEKFRRDHPPILDRNTDFEAVPVLAITLTSRPTERRIYGQMLMALGASVNERATLMDLEIRTLLLLKNSNVRVLIFTTYSLALPENSALFFSCCGI